MLAIFFVACSSETTKFDENALAVIGQRMVSKDDFAKRYRFFRAKTGEGVPDTYEARRQVLNSMVDEQLLLLEAGRRGYADDAEGEFERKRIEMQALLDAFTREMIAKNVQVKDAELKELFVRLNTRLKARHLYAPTKAKADSLYDCLQSGASFEALAKSTFQDPELRDSGGLLGYFSFDDMEPAFEDAAYDLAIGEISKPVKTSDGYSIIRVDDRLTKPMLTEFEFAKKRDALAVFLQRRKLSQAVQAYSDSVGKRLDISFDNAVCDKLFHYFNESRTTNGKAEPELASRDDELRQKRLVRSKRGEWDVATFRERARFTSEKQHGWIRSKEAFREFVAGLVVRDHILAEARKSALHKSAGYLEAVNEKWDDYLYDRIIAQLKAEMAIPEDSLRHYYEQDPERFAAPAAINLREIVLRDSASAALVAKKLENGEPFAELARNYSVRKWSATKGGELGFLEPADFGKWAQTVFALKVGEQIGPVRMDSMYVFLQCLAKRPSKHRSFAEARAEVEETVRYLAWEGFRSEKIAAIRESVTGIRVVPERLKTVRLN